MLQKSQMITKKNLYNAIEKSSSEMLNNSVDLKRIKSAKNYVANENLNHWAFSKLIATENFEVKYGGRAKHFFYNYGFINVLDIPNSNFRETVIQKFFKWSNGIENLDLREKFNSDQTSLKRFELLVHFSQIPKVVFEKQNLLGKNYDEFLEGFKTEIVKEVNYRNKELIAKAKLELGTTCGICNFNFEEKYGLHGKGFIEMHHLSPISEGKRISKINDLLPVCSNCHRMLHKGNITFAVEDIEEMIHKNKKLAPNFSGKIEKKSRK